MLPLSTGLKSEAHKPLLSHF